MESDEFMKKSFRFTVLLLLCFALLLPVHAESSISSIVEEPKRDTIIETAEIKVDPSGVLYYEITDRETLDIIADEDGIDLSDGKQLTKVITYYSDLSEPNSSEYLETTTNNTDIQPLGQTIMFEVRNVTDAGDLWYFENDTLRNSTYGPGPLSTSFTVTEQVTARYSYSGSFTILPDMLTAAVQFDVTDQ